MRCSINDIFTIISDSVETCAHRKVKKHHKVTNALEHHHIKFDLIDDLWNRRRTE